MELKEKNVLEGIVGQIDPERPFADISVVVDEMNLERARYLLSTDEILDEKFGQIHV